MNPKYQEAVETLDAFSVTAATNSRYFEQQHKRWSKRGDWLGGIGLALVLIACAGWVIGVRNSTTFALVCFAFIPVVIHAYLAGHVDSLKHLQDIWRCVSTHAFVGKSLAEAAPESFLTDGPVARAHAGLIQFFHKQFDCLTYRYPVDNYTLWETLKTVELEHRKRKPPSVAASCKECEP